MLNKVDLFLRDAHFLGTTTSISFVKDVLFVYARRHVHNFLLAHATEPDTAADIEAIRAQVCDLYLR
jgi:methionine salvage enolase-phosphatase E1